MSKEKNGACDSDSLSFFSQQIKTSIQKSIETHNKIEIKDWESINCPIWEELPQSIRLIEREGEINWLKHSLHEILK